MGRADYLEAAYSRVWHSFLTSSSTADGRHDTARWREHTGPYAACVVRIAEETLQPELSDFLSAIDTFSEVRVHPSYFLHVMLQELGYVTDEPSHPDEISPERLEEFAIAAIEPIASTSPISIALGGASAFHDAVFLEVGGGDVLTQLHNRLFDLAAMPQAPEFPYLPHCTVAHFTGAMPTTSAAEVIERWRQQRFGQLTIHEVEIVTLNTRDAYPVLESYAVIPLGG